MDILDFPAAEICHLIHASSLNNFDGIHIISICQLIVYTSQKMSKLEKTWEILRKKLVKSFKNLGKFGESFLQSAVCLHSIIYKLISVN